ncbi:LOW QUALITY PROTEIN: protein O-GlcNAcase-like [Ctenocephalides felis]|uniref:LOW QUALITY PROTEIN: protein O-GlcNAcase-like n=1 Tax=Ctenocephalides felis TaxID=7515 RepID=UPI000E6E32D7|nr:LOW QUALITY PROTEIN: protein O-GlcNAcase-like [Ctenocephalides felis]
MAEIANASKKSDSLGSSNGNFICGVVEGFYGRPWTTEQRKDLFQKLKKWGMDSYVYAPKDDYKHRAYWRELYTVEEADHLTGLITAAKDQGIDFYYALSPGLDITYSNSKEVSALKRKLEQVSQFGCTAFALLFDDIEPEMTEPDKEIFQSFAHAQVSVTNEIFQHLGCPKFLLCPTQYCSTRAVPSVTQSEYLNTLGSKLSTEIDIMWTGPKVISRILTVECIREITEVLRRPPVIWDNLHANDYDQKRVFLGPYSGRSPELIPYLRGVLSNPNCEYNANTVAIHTLAHWSKCSFDARHSNDSISADIKLETETEEGFSNEDAPMGLSKNTYHPRQALRNAIAEWLPEFSIQKAAFGPFIKPQPSVPAMPIIPILPSVNTCMSLTTTTSSTTTTAIPVVPTNQLQALADVCSTVSGNEQFSPLPNPVMNSLVSPTKVVLNDSIPNPITSTVANLPLPQNIPVSSIPVPIMSIKAMESSPAIETEHICNDSQNEMAVNNSTNEVDKIIDDDTVDPDVAAIITPAVCEDSKLNKMVSGNDEDFVVSNKSVINCTEMNGTAKPMNGDMATEDSSLSEPMECGSSNTSQPSPVHVVKTIETDVIMSESTSNCSGGSMQVETSDTASISTVGTTEMTIDAEKLDLVLLCDLFYLPFEHGSQGLQLLQEFHWLKTNAQLVIISNRSNETMSKPEVQEWFRRSDKFSTLCYSVSRLALKLAHCQNRELLHDLYSYVWDMGNVVSLLDSYVKWLALGRFPTNMASYIQGSYTWFSKGWKEAFMSGDQEPWVFRGGLTADLQRLIPVDAGNDLFIYKLPELPELTLYTIRPYTNSDEARVYRICHETCRDGSDATELFPEHLQGIPADRLVGPFLTLVPEFCMVIEDGRDIVGYACAALDARMAWIPEMCLKYPASLLDDGRELSQAAKIRKHSRTLLQNIFTYIYGLFARCQTFFRLRFPVTGRQRFALGKQASSWQRQRYYYYFLLTDIKLEMTWYLLPKLDKNTLYYIYGW